MRGNRAWIKRIGIIVFWLAVWQLLTWLVGNKILMAGPLETAAAWVESVQEPAFFQTVFLSLGRIGAGFALAFVLGCLLGMLAYRFRLMGELLAPPMALLKSVPVASFVVLLLIWWGSAWLSVSVVFLIVLPNVYVNFLQGLCAADPQMLEMARVFRMPIWNRFIYIYRPALRPFMDNCLKISLGMSWKSGVAAEVIGTPDFSIGERLYMSKVYLDTAGVFAWTVTVILLSFLFEKAGLLVWHRFCEWKPVCLAAEKPQTGGRKAAERDKWRSGSEGIWFLQDESIRLCGISKTYDGKPVLQDITHTLQKGKIYCLMAPSGSGKTTLLRILAGLEKPDQMKRLPDKAKEQQASATGSRQPVSAMVFQEDRLLLEETPERNVMLVCGSGHREEITTHLTRLLPGEIIGQRTETLSGGMKRRVALVRAVMAQADVLLLDEPFAGLDMESRRRAAAYLLEEQGGRTVILATHNEEDAVLLGGEIWYL